jgi:hypothetical protein
MRTKTSTAALDLFRRGRSALRTVFRATRPALFDFH